MIFTSLIGFFSSAGLKPRSFINKKANTKFSTSNAARMTYGTPRLVVCATIPPATDPVSIAAPSTISPFASTDSNLLFEAAVGQRVNQPGFHRAREKCKSQPKQH